MISRQLSPESPSEILARPHSFVSRDGARRGWLPKLGILARRDDGCGPTRGDYVVASARIIGPIGGDRGDVLIRWDLLQQVRQHRGVADIACGDPDRADLQCFLIHTEVKLAPQTFLAPAMFARVPLSFALGFDPCRIDQKMEWPRPATVRDGDVQRLLTAA